MMSSKYTIPTGDGYLGVYASDGPRSEISIGAMTHVDWWSTTTVEAVDIDDEEGIQLLEVGHDHQALCECPVKQKGSGTVVYLRRAALDALAGFVADEDIRVYRRDPEGLTVVPADDDPFVDGGDR